MKFWILKSINGDIVSRAMFMPSGKLNVELMSEHGEYASPQLFNEYAASNVIEKCSQPLTMYEVSLVELTCCSSSK